MGNKKVKKEKVKWCWAWRVLIDRREYDYSIGWWLRVEPVLSYSIFQDWIDSIGVPPGKETAAGEQRSADAVRCGGGSGGAKSDGLERKGREVGSWSGKQANQGRVENVTHACPGLSPCKPMRLLQFLASNASHEPLSTNHSAPLSRL